jgi:hypothetical protein
MEGSESTKEISEYSSEDILEMKPIKLSEEKNSNHSNNYQYSQYNINENKENKNQNSVKVIPSIKINDNNSETPYIKSKEENVEIPSVKMNEINNNNQLMVPDKLITELSSIALELMSNKPTEIKNKKDLLVYTKAMEVPSKLEMFVESRVVLRFFQVLFAIVAFVSLSVSSLEVNYKSSAIAESGINIMCLVSISSIIVACATLFVYFNPKFLGISPQRHFRSSRVEVCVDLLYLIAWLFASSAITIYGDCPHILLDITKTSEKRCYSWNICFGFGYANAFLYLFTFVRGIYDLKTHDWGRPTTLKYTGKGVHLWVRGNWKDEAPIEE